MAPISLSFGLLRHAGLALSLLDERVLDREAPDIDVVAYRGDDVKLEEIRISKSSRALGNIRETYHEATVHTDSQSQ